MATDWTTYIGGRTRSDLRKPGSRNETYGDITSLPDWAITNISSFAKNIGAEPVPAAGVPCQNSAIGGAGQQVGIPMCDMGAYVRDILDLIEWANGDAYQMGKDPCSGRPSETL